MNFCENLNTIYEYDKYDIIDFLEPEYIKDWLSTIPNDVWMKNKKTIENSIFELREKKIISFVINKINLNLPKFLVKNFNKINVELLKFCVEYDFATFKKEIKKNLLIYKQTINICITKHNYEFNKYFYETIYFELEPEHKIITKPINLNIFGILQNNNKFHKDNIFYDSIIKLLNGLNSVDYKILKYYNIKFKNVFANLDKKILCPLFINVFNGSKIDNYNDMIDLKNILGITDLEFKKKIIFGSLFNYNANRCIIRNICMLGNINFIFQVLNFCDDNILLKNSNICTLIVSTSLSKKIENVLSIYNYLVFEKKFKFTKELYSEIITNIIYGADKKHFNYKDIIIEFINLGGRVSGYSVYTDYIDRLKIKKK